MFKHAEINDDVFNDDSLEAHYWAGLIAADGCLSVKKAKYRDYNYVYLFLRGDDGSHVQALFDFLQSSYKLGTRTNTSHGYLSKIGYSRGGAFNSDKIWAWLHSHGITERKTKTLAVSDLLAGSPDFWRGFVDGDGTVNFAVNRGLSYPQIGLGGNFRTMEQFVDFAERIIHRRPKIGTCRSIYRVAVNGGVAQALIKALYARPGPALPRKALAAQACIDWQPLYASMQKI